MSGKCRLCGVPLEHVFVDLGMSPLSNAYLLPEQCGRMEPFYPLCAYVCRQCWLVQLEEFRSPEDIFSEYAYFSSYSESWLQHAREYARAVVERFAMGPRHRVVEIGSNDGYLLRNFRDRGVPVLGIEPASNVARVAEAQGIPTLVRFFGAALAQELAAAGQTADLLVGNNVLAHVPDLHDFVAGLKVLLGRSGVLSLEFPHLLRLMEGNQFDTIYHEHFSYFSLQTAEAALRRHGLTVFDVEELPTHGGSLRVLVGHEEQGRPVSSRVRRLRDVEQAAGLDRMDAYTRFAETVHETKRTLLDFLIRAKRHGQAVVAYGAAAKGTTLLNYCGIRTDFIDYVVDRSPHKQGRLLPGTHIPIRSPDRIEATRPDYVLILAWNLRDEIVAQMAHVRDWGGRFVVPIPRVEVL
jgi:SAM-dependent methyltransferase